MFDITLSFDNGPEPGATPRVLDVLEAEEVKATFFVLGAKLADPERRALAQRAYTEGHWIGNHTKTHSRPLGMVSDAAQVRAEIMDTQELLGDLSHPDRLFRPFGGGGELGRHLLSPAAIDILREQAMTCVLWNAVPRDWERPSTWVETALRQCLEREWTLLVLHDLPTGAMAHLAGFIDAVRARGGRFRQDFPRDCTPIVRGSVIGALDAYVAR
jgi:peptidoglycan/xylan/chitin deacetylase (PgdA/CDA1 family)